MFSTLLELVGFAAITAAAVLLGGTAAGLLTGGTFALLAGYATEDEQAVLLLARALSPVRRGMLAVRGRREQRRRRRDLVKVG